MDGPLEGDFGGDQSDGAFALPFVEVAFFHVDFEHRGEATAIARREASFGEGYVSNGIGIEDGEDAEQVRGVIDGYAVEQYEILIGAATAHVQAGLAFASGLHARQQLQGFEDVHFTHEGGKFFDLLYGHGGLAHLGVALNAIYFFGYDFYFLQDLSLGEPDVELEVLVEQEAQFLSFIAYVREQQINAVRRQGKAEKAIGVGNGTLFGAQVKDRGGDEFFAAICILHIAADGEFLLGRCRAGGEEKEQGKTGEGVKQLHKCWVCR